MRLYTVSCLEEYEDYDIVQIDDELLEEYEGINRIEGKWKNIEIEKASKGKKADIAFCWDFSDIIILQEAYEKIADIFCSDDVELLPVTYKNKKCFIPHIIKAYKIPYYIDKGDDAASYFRYEVEDIVKAGLNDKYFFKLKYDNDVISDVYYTEQFIELLNRHKLKGVEFEVAWESEA